MPDHSLQAPPNYQLHSYASAKSFDEVALSELERELLCGDTSDEVFRLLFARG